MLSLNTNSELKNILEKALSLEPLDSREGLELLTSKDLLSLGRAADLLRKKVVGDQVTFVIDRNINYTNICTSKCKFCAFYRGKEAKDAYVLSREGLLEKVREAVQLGATQILLQGGHNPDLTLDFYEEILAALKEHFPKVQRHAFSPSEISHIARMSGSSVKEVLKSLKDAGLQSIPGGGAEILVDRIRREISPNKIGWREWREVMVKAHKLGIPTTATMVYGLTETIEDRVKHIMRIREIQEKTHGFTAFIPWSFQPGNTLLSGNQRIESSTDGVEYLKLIAVSRLLLQNSLKNIQVSWVTQGPKVAQIALNYGANDFGGTMIEENVIKAAGVDSQYLPPEEIVRLIKDVGRKAAQRDTLYSILTKY